MKLSDEVTDAITKHLPGVVKSGLTLLERALNITDSVLDVVGEKARRAHGRTATRAACSHVAVACSMALSVPPARRCRRRRRPVRLCTLRLLAPPHAAGRPARKGLVPARARRGAQRHRQDRASHRDLRRRRRQGRGGGRGHRRHAAHGGRRVPLAGGGADRRGGRGGGGGGGGRRGGGGAARRVRGCASPSPRSTRTAAARSRRTSSRGG